MKCTSRQTWLCCDELETNLDFSFKYQTLMLHVVTLMHMGIWFEQTQCDWCKLCGVRQLQAFLAASLKNDDELLGWFNERLVWNDPGVVTEMLKNGLFVRIFAPQVLTLHIVRAFNPVAIQRLAEVFLQFSGCSGSNECVQCFQISCVKSVL